MKITTKLLIGTAVLTTPPLGYGIYAMSTSGTSEKSEVKDSEDSQTLLNHQEDSSPGKFQEDKSQDSQPLQELKEQPRVGIDNSQSEEQRKQEAYEGNVEFTG